MKVPAKVRAAVLLRASVDDWPQCEAMLPVCLFQANNIHHRINRSVGGGHEMSSLLLLCGSGTTGCHGWVTHKPTAARELGLALRSTDNTHVHRVMYRGRWAILTDDGGVHYTSELNPFGGQQQ